MSRLIRVGRRAGVVTVTACSVLAGLGLVFHLVKPDVLPRVDTTSLAGVLAMLVLPCATLGALGIDRAAVKRERGES
ncbi:MAG TPA: hypothetical protein PLU35_12670 [Phycisphaerales bacterium]|nr:hypothetical protein [Phycisphaerales bacterium]